MFGTRKLKQRITELEARQDALSTRQTCLLEQLDELRQALPKATEEDEAFYKAQQAMQDGIMNILNYGGVINGKRAE